MAWLANQFELSRGGGAHNVRPMEGLRGFAVFLVFIVHYVTLMNPWIPSGSSLIGLAESLHTIGNTGVDLFFVLSGYLIYGSLIARPQPFLKFMSRRVERIYPAFIVVLIAYIGLSFVFPAESKMPDSIGGKAVYIAENFFLLPGLFPIEPIITVAWSLSYEMFYYLVIPLIILLFGLRSRSAGWRVAFFIVAAVVIVGCCLAFGGPIRLIMFVSGILLYEVMRNDRVPRPASIVGLVALIVGLLGTLLPISGTTGAVLKICILAVTFFVVCLACFQDASAWLPRVFSWTPLRWLGNMSYSYYLLHGLALKAIVLVLSKVLPGATHASATFFWVLLLPLFFFTVVPTAALFLIVERPFSLTPRKRVVTGTAQVSGT